MTYEEWVAQNPELVYELDRIYEELRNNMKNTPEDIARIIEENIDELYL